MAEYKNPAATADIIVENQEKILLVKRKNPPYQNMWALPGGFLNCDKETLEEAAKRELEEETGLEVELRDLELVGVYSSPDRDPRGHVITHVYVAKKYEGEAKAGDDAGEARFFSLNSLPQLAFDHRKAIADYLEYRRKNGRAD